MLETVKNKMCEIDPELLSVPCSCPKGGKYDDDFGGYRTCPLCGGNEYVCGDVKLPDILRLFSLPSFPNSKMNVLGTPTSAGLFIETDKEKMLWKLDIEKLDYQDPTFIVSLFNLLT